MSNFDLAALLAIRQALESIDELGSRRVAALRAVPAARSAAEADRKLPQARYVTIYAGQMSEAALDHLRAWRMLIHGAQVPVRAHLTLLRAVLEAADRCRWHVEASARPGKRVGRALAARMDDQVERSHFEASREGGPRPPRTRGKSAIERIAELQDENTLKEWRAAGIQDVGFADTTSLMVKYGHERWFRIASGLAHGKEWALTATHMTPIPIETAEPGVGHGTVTASEPVAEALTLVAIDATTKAIEALEAYMAPRALSTGRRSRRR